MKKITQVFVLLLFSVFTYGQINFEQSYSYSGTYTKLANSGYKIYIMDVNISQCRIYNVDHSLWKSISLDVPEDHYLYDIRYVSEHLFTDDNTLALAFVFYYWDDVNLYYTYTAKIVTENGTELLSIPGCQYLYVHSLTDIGTKMTAYVYDNSIYPSTVETRVYNLPGELNTSQHDQPWDDLRMQAAFPNPAHDFVTVPYTLPDGSYEGTLRIMDNNGKFIKSYTVDRNFDHLRVKTDDLPQGMYLYRIESGSYTSPSQKLVIN